jgi:thiamine biosynthesis protein ThiS
MTILLNGEPLETDAGTIAKLLELLEIPPATLLIERNSQALPRESWAVCPLREGDQIEVLRVAAGG